jgi:hypothetical protein
MSKVMQKHRTIIQELRARVIKDKAQLNGALTPEHKDSFNRAIGILDDIDKEFAISMAQDEKQNAQEKLEQLNA